MRDATLLQAAEQGDAQAAGQLLPLVYAELRRLAAHRMAREASAPLQPTALVHEAWLRLAGDWAPAFASRAQFLQRGGRSDAADIGGVVTAE